MSPRPAPSPHPNVVHPCPTAPDRCGIGLGNTSSPGALPAWSQRQRHPRPILSITRSLTKTGSAPPNKFPPTEEHRTVSIELDTWLADPPRATLRHITTGPGVGFRAARDSRWQRSQTEPLIWTTQPSVPTSNTAKLGEVLRGQAVGQIYSMHPRAQLSAQRMAGPHSLDEGSPKKLSKIRQNFYSI